MEIIFFDKAGMAVCGEILRKPRRNILIAAAAIMAVSCVVALLLSRHPYFRLPLSMSADDVVVNVVSKCKASELREFLDQSAPALASGNVIVHATIVFVYGSKSLWDMHTPRVGDAIVNRVVEGDQSVLGQHIKVRANGCSKPLAVGQSGFLIGLKSDYTKTIHFENSRTQTLGGYK